MKALLAAACAVLLAGCQFSREDVVSTACLLAPVAHGRFLEAVEDGRVSAKVALVEEAAYAGLSHFCVDPSKFNREIVVKAAIAALDAWSKAGVK